MEIFPVGWINHKIKRRRNACTSKYCPQAYGHTVPRYMYRPCERFEMVSVWVKIRGLKLGWASNLGYFRVLYLGYQVLTHSHLKEWSTSINMCSLPWQNWPANARLVDLVLRQRAGFDGVFFCGADRPRPYVRNNAAWRWKNAMKWVWVKIRYPNNWMVNTKLD